MRFGFLNNFADQLAAPVSDTATSIELAGKASDIQAALQSADAVALTLFVADDQGDETQREVVYATAATPPSVTVTRAQEGTTAVTFAPGDGCEGRLTAGALDSLFTQGLTVEETQLAIGVNASVTGANSLGIGTGVSVSGEWSTAIGGYAEAGGLEAVAIGYANAGGQQAVAIGEASDASGASAVAVGANSSASGNNATATGSGASAVEDATAYGTSSTSGQPRAVTIGAYATANSTFTSSITSAEFGKQTIVGAYANSNYSHTTGVGDSVQLNGDFAVKVGVGGPVSSWAQGFAPTLLGALTGSANGSAFALAAGFNASSDATGSTALGYNAQGTVDGGLQINGLSYLPSGRKADFDITTIDSTASYSGSFPPEIIYKCSQKVTVATDVLSLTTAGAFAEINLPANTFFFIDSIDVVIVEVSGAGGAPEVQVGPNDTAPADYLAPTLVGKTAVGGRESHQPLIADGVTTLRASVATVGTGTTYIARVVFTGYVMEV